MHIDYIIDGFFSRFYYYTVSFICGILRYHNRFNRDFSILCESSSSNEMSLDCIYIFGKPVKDFSRFAQIIIKNGFTILGAAIGSGICLTFAVLAINDYFESICDYCFHENSIPGLLAAEAFLSIGKGLFSCKLHYCRSRAKPSKQEFVFVSIIKHTLRMIRNRFITLVLSIVSMNAACSFGCGKCCKTTSCCMLHDSCYTALPFKHVKNGEHRMFELMAIGFE